MMVKVQQAGKVIKPPIEIENVEAVAIYNRFGAPILATKQLSDEHILVTKLGDPDFQKTLIAMGVHKSGETLPQLIISQDS